MATPGMKFEKLTVELTRDQYTRNIEARVVQGTQRGENLLSDVKVRRVQAAKALVLADIGQCAAEIEFIDLAGPDTRLPYATNRHELQRDLNGPDPKREP